MRKDQRRRLMARMLKAMSSAKTLTPEFKGSLKKVVILAQEKFGDAVLLTPLFKNLKRCYPNCHITVLTFGQNQIIFSEDENVDAVFQLNLISLKSLGFLMNNRFDLLFNTKDHPSWTYLMYSGLIKAFLKVGIYHEYHEGLYHHLLDVPFQTHIVEKNCALLGYVKCQTRPEDLRPQLSLSSISADIKTFALQLKGKGVLGINLSAGEPSREWSFEKYDALIQSLKVPIVIFSMPDRQAQKEQLEQLYPHVMASPKTTSLFDVAALVKELDLLFTPDTSLIHIASCYNTPLVGLYRSDTVHLNRFSPYLTRHFQLISNTEKVETISVENALEALENMKSSHAEN